MKAIRRDALLPLNSIPHSVVFSDYYPIARQSLLYRPYAQDTLTGHPRRSERPWSIHGPLIPTRNSREGSHPDLPDDKCICKSTLQKIKTILRMFHIIM